MSTSRTLFKNLKRVLGKVGVVYEVVWVAKISDCRTIYDRVPRW